MNRNSDLVATPRLRVDDESFLKFKCAELYSEDLVGATSETLDRLPPFAINLKSMDSLLRGLRNRVADQFRQEEELGYVPSDSYDSKTGRLSAMANQLIREHRMLLSDLDDILAKSQHLEDKCATSIAECVIRIADSFGCFQRRFYRHEAKECQLIELVASPSAVVDQSLLEKGDESKGDDYAFRDA